MQETDHRSDTFTSFTFNLAVFVPDFFEVRGAAVPDKIPAAALCFGSIRSGRLVPSRSQREFWYDLGDDGVNLRLRADEYHAAGYSPRGPESLRNLLTADLDGYVLPFLAPLTGRVALRNAHRAQPQFMVGAFEALALALAVGDLESARTLFRQALKDRPSAADFARLRYGVDLRLG